MRIIKYTGTERRRIKVIAQHDLKGLSWEHETGKPVEIGFDVHVSDKESLSVRLSINELEYLLKRTQEVHV